MGARRVDSPTITPRIVECIWCGAEPSRVTQANAWESIVWDGLHIAFRGHWSHNMATKPYIFIITHSYYPSCCTWTVFCHKMGHLVLSAASSGKPSTNRIGPNQFGTSLGTQKTTNCCRNIDVAANPLGALASIIHHRRP